MSTATIERRGTGEGQAAGEVSVRMLGELIVHRCDGSRVRPEEFRTAKTRHLLRLLALEPGVPVRSEKLVELLWPGVPTSRARASLRTAASQLRRTLRCDAVTRVGDGLLLRRADVDVSRFEEAARQAKACFSEGRDDDGLLRSQTAIHLYKGDLAEDEPYLDPLLREQWRLREVLLDLLLEGGAAALRLGHAASAVEFGRRAVDLDDTCERACRLLMRSYLLLGEPSMALRAYGRCRHSIADELGVSPSKETQRVLALVLHADEREIHPYDEVA